MIEAPAAHLYLQSTMFLHPALFLASTQIMLYSAMLK